MAWFGRNSINQNVVIHEGNDLVWEYSCDHTKYISMFVQRLDGYGPDVYVLTADEFRLYKRGLSFKYITQLSYENIERFSNEGTLPRGRYFIVARLQQVSDGWDSLTEFAIRFEELE